MLSITSDVGSTVTPSLGRLLTFSWIDYTLFFLMFFFSALIGIYFGCFGSKQNTTSEYLHGSRNMKVFPVAMSLMAGHLSGITLLGVPTEIYMYGGQYNIFLLVCVLIVIIIVYIYLPAFYKLGVNSSYEYLKLRFDGRIRNVALLLYAIATFLYIPLVIYIPALAFNQVSGYSIHYITPIICAICIFYTTIGGLKAVVWADTLQFMVTLSALITVIYIGLKQIGGMSNLIEIASKGDRLDFFDMSPDLTVRTTFWGVAIGLTLSWTSTLGVNPSSVQRFLSVPTFNKAKLTVLGLGLGVLITKILTAMVGYIIYAKYHDCDPNLTHEIKKPDQLFPFFVLDIANDIPGFAGIFISGVFSTALSTMSAHLNTLAGTLYGDFISKFMPKKTTDSKANKIIKLLVVVAGGICVALVFVIEKLGGVIQASGCFTGITAGPLLGLFTLGMLFPQANTKGALWGAYMGLAIMTVIAGGFQYEVLRGNIIYKHKPLSVEGCSNSTKISMFARGFNESISKINEYKIDTFYLFKISFYWYPVIGMLLVVIIGLIVSYLTKDENDDRKYNKDLFCPLVHRFVPEYPKQYKALNVIRIHDQVNCPEDHKINCKELKCINDNK